jgi:hypothetical protein
MPFIPVSTARLRNLALNSTRLNLTSTELYHRGLGFFVLGVGGPDVWLVVAGGVVSGDAAVGSGDAGDEASDVAASFSGTLSCATGICVALADSPCGWRSGGNCACDVVGKTLLFSATTSGAIIGAEPGNGAALGKVTVLLDSVTST